MCDTLVAVKDATADGSTILAKNSDREPNEAQALTYVPRRRHEPGSSVSCTYLSLPQVVETNEVLLCRPFWMWGAEMGVNEHGVAIGNEAVFTREPYDKRPGLTGMDMLRLALERTATARQALELIVELLETYGQGGNCGFRHKLYYHNSFLIADPAEAWVLETAGKQWAAERVRDVRTISNGLTIGPGPAHAGLPSAGVAERAAETGWAASQEGLDLAGACADPFMTRMDGCRPRRARSTALLQARRGAIDVRTMMAALRDHGEAAAADPLWNPGRGWLMDRICVHASMGPTRPSQSVGSMVAHLRPEGPTVWVTGTSAPCTGIFKPVFLPFDTASEASGGGLPEFGPEPGGTADAVSLWWKHERLHRAVLRDYPTRLALYRAERDALEADFVREVEALAGAEPGARSDRRALSRSCFERAAAAAERWTAEVSSAAARHRPSWLFARAWDILERQAAGEPGRQ